jgi:peptidoglycan/xylan/chitin deacetylase (PgdA/CDA1 family)
MPIQLKTQASVNFFAPDAALPWLGRCFYTRRRLALFLILAVGVTTPVLLAFNWDHKFFFIGLELFTKFFIVYPAIRANCRWFGPVTTHFRTTSKTVWLTIDDGPHPQDTPELLKLLKKHNARATFFVIGQRVKQYPELARQILREGHTLANHSQTHPALLFWCRLETQLKREIDDCAETLRQATGEAPRWFRAPAGMANLFVHFLMRDRGMKLIGWSARGFDGLMHDIDGMADRICKAIKPGAIVLLHEGRRDRQGRAINVMLADTILNRLQAEGYGFTVPDEADFR